MVKTCNDCGLEKDWSEYSMIKSRGTPQSYCSLCAKIRGKKYYKYNAHKDWVRKLLKRYGITEGDYMEIYDTQKGCCKICAKHQDTLDRRLCVDHCHSTGKVRGLLCDGCNKGIGLLGDTASGVYAAYNYLKGIEDEDY